MIYSNCKIGRPRSFRYEAFSYALSLRADLRGMVCFTSRIAPEPNDWKQILQDLTTIYKFRELVPLGTC